MANQNGSVNLGASPSPGASVTRRVPRLVDWMVYGPLGLQTVAGLFITVAGWRDSHQFQKIAALGRQIFGLSSHLEPYLFWGVKSADVVLLATASYGLFVYLFTRCPRRLAIGLGSYAGLVSGLLLMSFIWKNAVDAGLLDATKNSIGLRDWINFSILHLQVAVLAIFGILRHRN